jgi:hypothetical protein
MDKVRLVDNWKGLHKTYTVIISVLMFLLGVVEIILPQLGIIQPLLDPATYGIITFVMTILIGVGRYIKQGQGQTPRPSGGGEDDKSDI